MDVTEGLSLKGTYRILLHDAATGNLVADQTYDNLVCTNGKVYIAAWMNQEAGFGAMPTVYGAVGTSGTAPIIGDTQLGAELDREVLGVPARASNVLTWSFFYNTSQANGTWAEAGVFLNGTASANTGTLFSHVLVTLTKTAVHTATVQFTLTIG